MKEITRIHIARTPYSAEVDAKKALEEYLAAIKKSLSADDDAMREIEARIVEILAGRGIANEGVITHKDVEAIEAQLGAPSDFADEDAPEESVEQNMSERRLMRDTSRGVLGGVCAGIANYYGVNVMWPRLVAVLIALITSGTAIFVYIVMWIVVPPARTAAEKLQMRGKPVTLAALQSESKEEVREVPERSKPFVVFVRVLLGLAFVGTGLMSIVALVAVSVVRKPLFGYSFHDLSSGGMLASIGVAYAGIIAAAILFAILMGLGAYASFAWRLTKRLAVLGSVVVILGLVSFGTAVGFGIYGVNQIHQQIDQLKVTDASKLANLNGISTAVIEDNSSIAVKYVVTNDAPHVAITHLKGQSTAKVSIVKTGDAAKIAINDEGTCEYSDYECNGFSGVTIYGPELKQLAVDHGELEYQEVKTSELDADVNNDTELTLHGSFESLVANVDDSASLSASDAAIQKVALTMAASANAHFGTVNDLALTVPTACAIERHGQLSTEGVTHFTINGQTASVAGRDYDANTPCIMINHW
jgi:phage shock protein PspC (stress-responsive transcriptional regulator)